ncbi:MAG: 3-hydroxyacyl-CoA dehydrogenase family protein [Bacteroidota bacterium]|nr:3-hydroxyacyl-CoA dehydrogenase family protein [Bacteroidota bacterium]
MKLIIVGDKASIKEFKLKFSKLIKLIDGGAKVPGEKQTINDNAKKINIDELIFIKNYDFLNASLLNSKSIVFDFYLEECIENFEIYKNQSNLIIFGNIPTSSLSEIRYYFGEYKAILFGFNGMPGMLNREYFEVTALSEADHLVLQEACAALHTEFLRVDDRVGMVTLRVVAMIINEAYFTVQEGTASKDDIDIAMKLGTNYPYGPFEWCLKLGIKNVYELLEALYEDTKDERYRICPLLKREYMKAFS